MIYSSERVTIVFEHYDHNELNVCHHGILSRNVAEQILDAFNELHCVLNTVHGLIDSNSIVWCGKGALKLTHWAIHKLTEGGTTLESDCLVPQDKRFLAPEQVRFQSTPRALASKKSDIWSSAILLATQLWPSILTEKMPANISSRLALCDTPQQVIDLLDLKSKIMLRPNSASSNSAQFSDESNSHDARSVTPNEWLNYFTRALDPDPHTRADLGELYSILNITRTQHDSSKLTDETVAILNGITVNDQQQQSVSGSRNIIPDVLVWSDTEIERINVRDLYHLWRLSWGRNFFDQQTSGKVANGVALPPIFHVPYLILAENQMSSPSEQKRKTQLIIETKVESSLPLDKLKESLEQMDPLLFYPLILTSPSSLNQQQQQDNEYNSDKNDRLLDGFDQISRKDQISQHSDTVSQTNTSQSLPLIIREADFSYQCERMVLFKRLLAGCPYLKRELVREAHIDIPPYYRAQTWAVLLDLCPSKLAVYDRIDKTTPTSTDRQISVDIPRCHQYNELMASPQGHQKLTRVLKAWLNYNKSEYVYWQGLDSLAAPFLLLNFADESMAFACFHEFVQKYLRGFFQKDNQLVVQRYLDLFFDLLSYHDSALAIHLDRLGFSPNLYAIPWFLTMFTHVLPLHKILHVWDRLLLGNETFPLCIGLAILAQFRDELLSYTFNDCIVVFSDLPEIDIERCINDACHFYATTPSKLIGRGPLLSPIGTYSDNIDDADDNDDGNKIGGTSNNNNNSNSNKSASDALNNSKSP
ncbi:TBC domain-containing protein kinase-like protein [Fragariocoptes setiger]|uniref:TBC domain-containing protein kinase-like protein n=1 Tax=Fragariocoptes setiger TaxID=1670756 RepID=A0ABQ7S8V1_9ACAR|nr:TBC domain-containing protein kinase-like protein [Fragariocoptes setiger]